MGAEASGAAAGMLAPQVETAAGSPLLELALRARDHLVSPGGPAGGRDGHPRGALRRGHPGGRVQRGGGARARRAPRAGSARAASPWSGSDRRSCARRSRTWPRASRRALFFPRDRSVDNVRLTRALAASAVAAGASLLCGRPVTGLLRDAGGRVAGVRAGAETFRAPVGDQRGRRLGGPAGRRRRARRPSSPCAARSWPSSSRRPCCGTSCARRAATSCRARTAACWPAARPSAPGFDKSVTAGGLRAVLDTALQIAPALGDVRVADAWAGLRPGTPDGLPVIGPGAAAGARPRGRPVPQRHPAGAAGRRDRRGPGDGPAVPRWTWRRSRPAGFAARAAGTPHGRRGRLSDEPERRATEATCPSGGAGSRPRRTIPRARASEGRRPESD